MQRKLIIINGNHFSDLESFYTEIDKVLTKNLKWKTGHNLDAFNDILCGGFGVFQNDDQINLNWINFSKSQTELTKETTDLLVGIIEKQKHIKFTKIE
ncbi:barstar family protein [Flavobacterium sp. GT3R68]|uniref:barstar family protein n=1 Tax=Flavobacterium sp. GT3R68 TaxID=2594437 RepID=UPI000F880100|nr:barstar family protein [Flavobacterium sp. GT3R68]RTY85906.1 Barstar (barnase inhibitor) [Flavobacterium sp. GSN2]TRW89340.1 Barstar (barnase inhibitor) [Flavobacterium sp. GT3R68]